MTKHLILYRLLKERRQRQLADLAVSILGLERIRDSIRTRNKINTTSLNRYADGN